MPLFFLLLSNASPDARSENPWIPLDKVTTRNFTRLSFLDSARGWVVGDSGTILKTINGGGSWTFQESGLTNTIADICMLNERLGWAIAQDYTDDTSRTIVLKTTDGGDRWLRRLYPQPERIFNTICFVDSAAGWMGGNNGTFAVTTNGGMDWFEAERDTSVFARFPVNRIRFFSRGYGLAVGGRMDFFGLVWRTPDYGRHWIPTRVSPEPIYGIHFLDSLNVICVGGDPEFGAGVGRTTDGGARWEFSWVGIYGEARSLAFRTTSEGWAPLGFSGSYMCTRDSGRTWTEIFTPDSSAVYDVTFTDESHGYMVGANGTVLKYHGGVSSVEPPRVAKSPATYTLAQNFPNPFNGSTTVAFSVPTASSVTLTVYDVLGREVASLASEEMTRGSYERAFDGTGRASGVYWYRLLAGDFVATKKLILIK